MIKINKFLAQMGGMVRDKLIHGSELFSLPFGISEGDHNITT